MSTVISFCPVQINLCVSRADSPIIALTVNALDELGQAVTLDGTYSFIMTVDPSPAPISNANNLFSVNGIVRANNRVTFQPTSLNLTQVPSVYFYDVQMTTPIPSVRTVAAGQFEIQQDVTK